MSNHGNLHSKMSRKRAVPVPPLKVSSNIWTSLWSSLVLQNVWRRLQLTMVASGCGTDRVGTTAGRGKLGFRNFSWTYGNNKGVDHHGQRKYHRDEHAAGIEILLGGNLTAAPDDGET